MSTVTTNDGVEIFYKDRSLMSANDPKRTFLNSRQRGLRETLQP